MGQIYTVTRTQNAMYLDEGSNPVPGYLVRFIIHEFGEGFDINVPSLEPAAIDKRVQEIVANRKALDELGA